MLTPGITLRVQFIHGGEGQAKILFSASITEGYAVLSMAPNASFHGSYI